MIDVYFWPTGNGKKITIMLEEVGAALPDHSGEHQQGRPVHARIRGDQSQQQDAGDRRSGDGDRRRRRSSMLRVRRHPAIPRGKNRQADAAGPAWKISHAAVGVLAGGRAWADGGAGASLSEIRAAESRIRDAPFPQRDRAPVQGDGQAARAITNTSPATIPLPTSPRGRGSCATTGRNRTSTISRT